MEVIRGLHNLHGKHRGCVATIGNFDGVHLGHVSILQQVKKKAAELSLPTTVIIFEPQPREYFGGEQVPPRLTRFGEKVRLLQAQGIDRVMCLPFNEKLRAMTADQFVEDLLLQGLAVKHFVVGDDFRFGCDRSGDYQMLSRAGESHGFSVVNTQTYLIDNRRVSSTRIRAALADNDLTAAAALLGRPYSIAGRVVHGQKLGRQLGVPTANIHLHRFSPPLKGVYAVKVLDRNNDLIGNAVCNIGMRPTVNGSHPVLEAHLLDFSADLYDLTLRVEFCAFIRAEQKFSGLDELKTQIYNDIEATKHYFAAQ